MRSRSRSWFALGAALAILGVGWWFVGGEGYVPAAWDGASGSSPVEHEPVAAELELSVSGAASARRAEVGGTDDAAASSAPNPRVVTEVHFRGRLRGADGQRLLDPVVHVRVGDAEFEAEAAEDGRFAFEPIRAGVWTVRAEADLMRAAIEEIDTRGSEWLLEREYRLEPLREVRVHGVTPEGEPLREALRAHGMQDLVKNVDVVATQVEPRGAVGHANGILALEPEAIGSFDAVRDPDPSMLGVTRLDLDSSAWLTLGLNGQVLATEPLAAGADSLTFVVSSGELRATCATIRGRVVDGASGEPLHAVVLLTQSGDSLGSFATQADGSFALSNRPPGEATLVVRAPGRAELLVPLLLTAGRDVELGTIELRPPTSITGWIDDGGLGIQGMLVVEVHRVGQRPPVVPRAPSFPIGDAFELSDVEAAEWVLVGRRSYTDRSRDARLFVTRPVRVDARAGAVADVRLVLLEAAPLSLRYPYQRERPYPLVVARDADGTYAGSTRLGGEETTLHLAPGRYTLEVSHGPEHVSTQEVDLPPGGRVLRLDL